MNEIRQITTIVEDHVERLAARESGKGLLDAPEILLICLSLPGVDRHTGSGNSSGRMVLCGEDVLIRK